MLGDYFWLSYYRNAENLFLVSYMLQLFVFPDVLSQYYYYIYANGTLIFTDGGCQINYKGWGPIGTMSKLTNSKRKPVARLP